MTWQYNGSGKPILRYETAHHKKRPEKAIDGILFMSGNLDFDLAVSKVNS